MSFFLSLALAQEASEQKSLKSSSQQENVATENVETENVATEDLDNDPSEVETKSLSVDSQEQLKKVKQGIPIEVQLINGIFLKATALSEELIFWEIGEELSLILEDETELILAGQRIAKVVSLPAQHEESQEKTDVALTVRLVNGIDLSGTVRAEDMVTWNRGEDLVLKPYGQDEVLLEGRRIAAMYQYDASNKKSKIEPVKSVLSGQAPQLQADELLPYVSPEGFSYPNPAASRYLYAPSSIPMKQGQGYVSQKLVITSAAYAIDDTTTILAGTFTFAPPLLTVVGFKKSFKLSDQSYLAVGGEAFFIPIDSEMALGIGFVSYSQGNLDRHFSIAMGVMGGDFFTSDVLRSQGPSIPLVVSGHKRLSDRAALVTENWVITNIHDLVNLSQGTSPLLATANSLVFRILGKRDVQARKRAYLLSQEGYPRTTWDVGLIFVSYREQATFYWNNDERIPSDFVNYSMLGPLPWVDFAWHFGPSGE